MRSGDEILGEGATYQVRFRADSVVFTPPPVTSASIDPRLVFRLQKVARRDAAGVAVDAVAPVDAGDGKTVLYSRGSTVERYELRPDGVEQSFVFSSLPPGDGDLVVRLAVETALPLTRAAHDEIRFEVDGLGGVVIGAVLGIDADGAEMAGSLAFQDGVLELSLPAAFVDSAALPLVLDPLIGSTLPVASGTTYNESDPDVAATYGTGSPGTGSYIVVWQRVGFGIRGQRLDESGTPIGGTLFIRNGATVTDPRVAVVKISDAFAVVWQEGSDIWGTAVDIATGAVSPAIAIAATGDFESAPDIGGSNSGVGWTDDAIVVWRNSTQRRIEAAQFEVHRDTGALRAHDKTTIASGTTTVNLPAISKTSGRAGYHLIAWQREAGGASQTDILGAIVDRALTFVTTFTIASSTNDEDDPAVDGDGTCWVVAYETETTSGSGDNDIACRGVCRGSGFSVHMTPEVMVEAGTGDDEINPSVAWLRETAVIAHADEVSSGVYDMYAVTVDAFDCTRCEGRFSLDVAATDDDSVRIATRSMGAVSVYEDALLVWDSRDTTTLDHDIDGRLFEASDGDLRSMGGDCLSGGTVHASCAIVGNASFDFDLVLATPFATCWLLLSPNTGRFPCGSCEIVPDPYTGFVFPGGTTDSNGYAELAVAIPNSPVLQGAAFYCQWMVTGSSCYGFDLSNGLRVVIE